MQIKHNILFFPDKKKDSNYGYLRVRVRWGCLYYTANLGYDVEIDKWVNSAQRVKANTTHGKKKIVAVVINKEIERQTQIIEDCFLSFERQNKIPTKDEFIGEYTKRIGKRKQDSLQDEYNTFLDTASRENSWTIGTKRKFNVTFNKFIAFSKIKSARDITEKLLRSFVEFLIENNYRNVSIEKDIKCIFRFLRWAKKQGIIENVIDFNPKLKTVQKTIVFLDWDELQKVFNFDYGKNYLNHARDLFCFCCFTGLRYSDMAKLTRANVYDEAIHIITKKTNDSITIDLNDYSKSILEKYDYCLPVISNVKLNKYIKELGEKAGINKPIKMVYYVGNERREYIDEKWKFMSTHCGRRTFVCNALMLGISPQVIMKWTGHSDYKSMRPYMEIADSYRKSEMGKFNKK